MSKLNSTAVMQRRTEKSNSLDDFPTPPWATRVLLEFLKERGAISEADTCREPAANRGYMVNPLSEYFSSVEASDIYDYGVGFPVKDYLSASNNEVDWTITNPPFIKAEEFILEGFKSSSKGVAVILRTAFLETKGRYERLFSKYNLTYFCQFVERVPMVKGKYDPKASSATAYGWFVWLANNTDPTELVWLPPCKEKYTKESDYS